MLRKRVLGIISGGSSSGGGGGGGGGGVVGGETGGDGMDKKEGPTYRAAHLL